MAQDFARKEYIQQFMIEFCVATVNKQQEN